MAPLMKIQGVIMLIWLFILSAGVSSYRNECWTFLPTICLVPLAIISSCCIRICINYYSNRNALRFPRGPSMSSPPPFSMPDRISVEDFELRVLPSYSEAVGKPSRYQLPLDDPPAYEDIAMQSVSSPDTGIPPAFMPRNNNSIV